MGATEVDLKGRGAGAGTGDGGRVPTDTAATTLLPAASLLSSSQVLSSPWKQTLPLAAFRDPLST